jgi:hypothetical protein
MEAFQARRVTKEYTHQLSAAAGRVFPLLCPTREYDWIDGWACRMVFSQTGVAENNCVFRTNFPRGVEDLFVVTRYEPERNIIQFVVIGQDMYVLKMDVSLEEAGDNASRMHWTNTFTGLTPEGNTLVDEQASEVSDLRMSKLVEALEHYCVTGKMLKRSLLQSLHASLRGS